MFEISEKQCFKCKIMKPIAEFYKHKTMKDGYLNKCKDCAKRDIRIFRRDNDHVREYDRKRAKTEKRKTFTKFYNEQWRLLNPDSWKAHWTVHNAINRGELIKQPCKICGELKVHAHHKDYSKPLDVEWFCARHHSKYHNPEIS